MMDNKQFGSYGKRLLLKQVKKIRKENYVRLFERGGGERKYARGRSRILTETKFIRIEPKGSSDRGVSVVVVVTPTLQVTKSTKNQEARDNL